MLMIRRAVIAVSVLPMVGACGFLGNKPTTTQAVPIAQTVPQISARAEPVAKVHAYTLWELYGQNAAKAETDYNGKPIAITGQFHSIRKDESGAFVLGIVVADGQDM